MYIKFVKGICLFNLASIWKLKTYIVYNVDRTFTYIDENNNPKLFLILYLSIWKYIYDESYIYMSFNWKYWGLQ